MSVDKVKNQFIEAMEEWVCDGYSCDIRFFATNEEGKWHIRSAAILLNPLPADQDNNLLIQNSKFVLGQVQKNNCKNLELINIIEGALLGELLANEIKLELPEKSSLYFFSETNQRNRWFYDLHLQVSGGTTSNLFEVELINIDNYLRSSQPPFDGLLDAASWLGLNIAETSQSVPAITIRINPPIELAIDRSNLLNNVLNLTLLAHKSFDTKTASLAVRALPGSGLESRIQCANYIEWKDEFIDRKEGTAQIELSEADNALAMLMISRNTVRRQFFIDAEKARNSRLLAVQHYDKDLKMVRHAVLETPDSNKFENGIAVLLFLLGFTPSVQIETDSPDIIVTTPAGRIVIIECTTRVADFSYKLGKLVDRKGSLSKHLHSKDDQLKVAAVLVCRQPDDQIAARSDELRANQIILVTEEDLVRAFDQLRYYPNPDQILAEAESKLKDKTKGMFSGYD